MPKPFARPSVDLTGHGRVWADVPAEVVEVGDLVAGLGLVSKVQIWPGAKLVHIWAGDDGLALFTMGDTVRAFITKDRA